MSQESIEEIVGLLLAALNNCAKLAHKNTASHSYWLSFRECGHTTCKAATEVIRRAEKLETAGHQGRKVK